MIKTMRGFTLIELMVVVAIMGIITAIAYPSYVKQVQKAKRSDAMVALQEITQRQESYFLRQYSYAKDLTQLGYPATSAENLYSLSLTALPAGCTGLRTNACTSYTTSASAVSGKPQEGDKTCKTLSLDNRGKKTAKDNTNTDSTVCW